MYATKYSLGQIVEKTQYVEFTPEIIRDFISDASAFEKIGCSPQVIADLVVEYPSMDERTTVLKTKYNLTDRQAILVQTLPFREVPLYFDKHEYTNQVERLKTLQRLLQEMQDVLDK